MDQNNEKEAPPPLFDNVDINDKEEEEDIDYLFESAIQDVNALQEPLNGTETDIRIPKPDILQTSTTLAPAEMETVSISNDSQNVSLRNQSISNSTLHTAHGTENGDNFIEVTVTEPQKIGDGMSAYLAYRVITHTNMPIFRRRSMNVTRRFSDFLGLHTKLTEKYLRAGRIIPPVPEKSVIGMTKIKISSQSSTESPSSPHGSTTPTATTQASSADWVERRRASLERFLIRTAKHPVLGIDPDFRAFLETEGDLPRATSTKALSSAGVLRLFNKVGETVNKITYKMDETDPWFEDKIEQVDALDSQFRRLHAAVESLVSHRRDLSINTGMVAKSLAVLSGCEEHTGLSRVLSQLADTEEKVELLRSEQANSDFFIFSEMLKDYIGLFGSIKEVFHERVKVFQNWQHSQYQLTKKRENKAKLEISGRNDKLDQAGVEVLEWESKVVRGQEEFDNISRMIRKEIELLEATRVKEFKETVIKYLEDHMAHQQQLVQYWEDFLPQAKAIA